MKTSRLSDAERTSRRERIMAKRRKQILATQNPRRRSYVSYMTTYFPKTCGIRQQSRYARQLAAGQITFIEHGPKIVAQAEKPKVKRPRAKKASA